MVLGPLQWTQKFKRNWHFSENRGNSKVRCTQGWLCVSKEYVFNFFIDRCPVVLKTGIRLVNNSYLSHFGVSTYRPFERKKPQKIYLIACHYFSDITLICVYLKTGFKANWIKRFDNQANTATNVQFQYLQKRKKKNK